MFVIISLCIHYCNAHTTTNTCENEPEVYKLDIRERILSICDTCTIADIDYNQICAEAQQYDYIWLTQLWTPSIYNYRNQTNPEQVNDYREFQCIKEYYFDPQLGTKEQFIYFLSQLKSKCYHIKFLGEFSFYIGQDSSLLQNKTRFLSRPLYISFNQQDNRYDDGQLLWAVDSQGKTIPFTAPIEDMKDIIYNQILADHLLDGVVFLQPSLGLYSVARKFYLKEVQYYADSTMLKDFYENFGIKSTSTDYYFMGDSDTTNAKNLLLSIGLRQIYGSQPIKQFCFNSRSNLWLNVNYTFSQEFHADAMVVTNLTCKLNQPVNAFNWQHNAAVDQPLDQDTQQCITFNFTRFNGDTFSGTLAGIVSITQLQKLDFKQPQASSNVGVYGITFNEGNNNLILVLTNYFNVIQNRNKSFPLRDEDKIQVSLDMANQNQLVFRKLESSFIRVQQLTLNQTFRFGVGLNMNNKTRIAIAFPYQFSENLKSLLLTINGDRHIECKENSDYLQFAQVFQSINQNEQNTTLNMLALNLPPESVMALGVCDKDLIKINKHQLKQKLQSGAYLYQSNGSFIHSSIDTYNNEGSISGFQKGDLISITFIKSNYSVVYKRNSDFVYSMLLGQYIRNINFCLGFHEIYQSVSLEY